MSNLTFYQLEHALEAAGCQTRASECHATLTGLICAARALPEDWMERVTGGGDNGSCRSLLDELAAQVQGELGDGQMAFDLLLPDDDTPLDERTQSLAQWCQAFLYGLTVGGMQSGQPLPGDTADVIKDFSAFSEAEHSGEANEEDEIAYSEICEFVRVGSQLVYEELSASRNQEK